MKKAAAVSAWRISQLFFVGYDLLTMTEEVFQTLMNIVTNRHKINVEPLVDGYSGFILIDKELKQPKVALLLQNACKWAQKRYDSLHPDRPLPHNTPHVYRHTFCTNMVNAGMEVKALQYIMGHSDVGTTLNIYTHMSYDKAAAQMIRLVDDKANMKDVLGMR